MDVGSRRTLSTGWSLTPASAWTRSSPSSTVRCTSLYWSATQSICRPPSRGERTLFSFKPALSLPSMCDVPASKLLEYSHSSALADIRAGRVVDYLNEPDDETCYLLSLDGLPDALSPSAPATEVDLSLLVTSYAWPSSTGERASLPALFFRRRPPLPVFLSGASMGSTCASRSRMLLWTTDKRHGLFHLNYLHAQRVAFSRLIARNERSERCIYVGMYVGR